VLAGLIAAAFRTDGRELPRPLHGCAARTLSPRLAHAVAASRLAAFMPRLAAPLTVSGAPCSRARTPHCTGEKGVGKMGKPLHFKGSAFHRVIPQFMCA
jgi:hypothetical protein